MSELLLWVDLRQSHIGQERQQELREEQRAQQQPQPSATNLTHRNKGFGYENQGCELYKIGGAQMVSPSGKVHQTAGSMLYCN